MSIFSCCSSVNILSKYLLFLTNSNLSTFLSFICSQYFLLFGISTLSNGGISILGDVYKTDVYALAHYINREEEIIPINTIIKAPSAELRPNQKDSDSLPEYDILDKILFAYIEQKLTVDEIVALKFDRNTVERTITMVNNNEFKRFQCPPILRISSKAFGLGRRMPLVAKYK